MWICTEKVWQKKGERQCSVFENGHRGWQCSVLHCSSSLYKLKMGGNAPFLTRFSLLINQLGGNAPFFVPFLPVFRVFERQYSVFLTLLGAILSLKTNRFLGG